MNTTRIHTDAFIQVLVDAGLTVGDAIGKTPAGVDLTKPHAVVYPGPGDVMGTLDDPQSDAEMTWRVVYVGKNRQETEFVRDKGREALLEGFAVTDRAIVLVIVDEVGEVERDDSVKPPSYYCSESYRVWSTPDNGGS